MMGRKKKIVGGGERGGGNWAIFNNIYVYMAEILY